MTTCQIGSAETAINILAVQPVTLLDGLNVGDLRAAVTGTPQEAFATAGFAIHYWRPAAPASRFGDTEMVFTHTATGLWFAASVTMQETRNGSDVLTNLEAALAAATVSGPAACSLAALTQSVATRAASSLVRVGEAWTVGGVLLGCLRAVHEHSPADVDATRMLIALADPDLLGQLDRLACWQDNVATDRAGMTEAVERAYVRATADLWPRFSRVAETVAMSVKPDRLLSYPREGWDTAAPQIILDAVVAHETYAVRPLQAAWQNLIRHPEDQPQGERFTLQGLLDMARLPDGVSKPALITN